jgi:phosphoribosylformylglycinamidine synthase
LLIAVIEMAMASRMGCDLSQTGDAAFWFGEDQARYVVATVNADDVIAKAKQAGVPVTVLGRPSGGEVKLAGVGAVAVAALCDAHEAWLPEFMA